MNKNGGNQGTGSSTRHKVLTGIVALLLIPLAMSQPKAPPAPRKPSFKLRAWEVGQVLLFLVAGFILASVVTLSTLGGLGIPQANALGAAFVALGGTLGIAGAARNIGWATDYSWSLVLLGGWIIALVSFWPLVSVTPGAIRF